MEPIGKSKTTRFVGPKGNYTSRAQYIEMHDIEAVSVKTGRKCSVLKAGNAYKLILGTIKPYKSVIMCIPNPKLYDAGILTGRTMITPLDNEEEIVLSFKFICLEDININELVHGARLVLEGSGYSRWV